MGNKRERVRDKVSKTAERPGESEWKSRKNDHKDHNYLLIISEYYTHHIYLNIIYIYKN